MLRQCDDCGRRYDDEFRWTICPHRNLGDNPKEYPMDQERATVSRHPATEALLRFFAYEHLPEKLQEVSKPFNELAYKIADGPQNAEATVALRKLLESKDAAVRAAL